MENNKIIEPIHKRSVGVTVMGWGMITLVLFHTLIGLVSTIRTISSRQSRWGNYSFVRDPHIMIILQLLFFILVVGIVCGVGVLKLKKWAMKLYVVTTSLVGVIFLLITLHNLSGLLLVLFFFFPLYFFTRPKVREQFK